MYNRVCSRIQELQESGEDASHIDPSNIWCFYQDLHDILTRDEELSSLLTPVPGKHNRTGDDEMENDDDSREDSDDDDSDWSASNLTTGGKDDRKHAKSSKLKGIATSTRLKGIYFVAIAQDLENN